MVKNTLLNYAVMRGDRSVLVPLPLFKKCCTSGHNYFSKFTNIFLHRQVPAVWATSAWAFPASCSEATPPPSTAAGTWTSEGRYIGSRAPQFWHRHQEAYKGEIQCPILPNQICFLTLYCRWVDISTQLLRIREAIKKKFTTKMSGHI